MAEHPTATVTLHPNGALPRSFTVDADNPLRFGRVERDGIVGLDPNDSAISRAAGTIGWRDGHWVIDNTSTKRPLVLELPRQVRHQTLPPGAAQILDGPALILVPGAVATHDLHVDVPTTAAPDATTGGGTDLPLTVAWQLTEGETRALAALAAGYLRRWPRHDPNPLSYADAAALTDSTPAGVRRHSERVRERLVDEGVPGLQGTHGLRALIEYLIDTAMLHIGHLELLEEPHRRI